MKINQHAVFLMARAMDIFEALIENEKDREMDYLPPSLIRRNAIENLLDDYRDLMDCEVKEVQ